MARPSPLPPRIRIGFGLALVLVVGIVSLTIYTTRASIVDRDWVSHTRQVMIDLQATLAGLNQAKADASAFLLTGDSAAKTWYSEDVARTRLDFDALRDATRDNPAQTARLDSLAIVLSARFAVLNRAIVRRDLKGAESAVLAGVARGMIASAYAVEDSLLRIRASRSEASRTTSLFVLGTLVVLVLGLLVAVYLLTARDIRGRQAPERELERRAADLEAALAELESFSYTVSHDLRAPLRAMDGFSRALLEDYAGQLDATGVDYARRIVAAAARMDGLIQDLLAYSRAGRDEFTLSSVSLDDALAEAARQVGSGAELVVAGPLGMALAHPRALVQVLANLLSNAAKFVAPGTPPRVTVSAERRDGKVRLWVEDNGIGIAPEHRERVFRVFERLHGQEAYPGTGIGLAIVRRVMGRMGGTTGVESAPGSGSRFWIECQEGDTSP